MLTDIGPHHIGNFFYQDLYNSFFLSRHHSFHPWLQYGLVSPWTRRTRWRQSHVKGCIRISARCI